MPVSKCCSSYKQAYGPIDDKPVKFRDGMPIDARRISGKPLMVFHLSHLPPFVMSSIMHCMCNKCSNACTRLR